MKQKISIIGCGWLGFPLAKALIDKGYSVKGSTTSEAKLSKLKAANIDDFLIQLTAEGMVGDNKDFLADSHTIIINIPPGIRKNPGKNHVAELQHLISAIENSSIKNVLYISSTSVFLDDVDFPTIKHDTSPNGVSNSAQQLIKIEELLQNNPNFNTSIIRFGGLFNETRHPARYLSGRQNVSNPEAPINLIHLQDCIGIISEVIVNNHWNCTLNAASPSHPSKKDYYTAYCEAHNLVAPQFNFDIKSQGKLIDSSKVEQLLNYTFQYNP